MKHYAMTGGATGIGAAIKQRLLDDGHSVLVVDLKNADIVADLSTAEGRNAAIAGICEHCTEGLDGFITCAGVGPDSGNARLITTVNYFGSVELIEGVNVLLTNKRGGIVMISSNSAPMPTSDDFVQYLLAGDEDAALNCADSMAAQEVYSGTKRAVARWMRSNTSRLAANGVRVNAIAPGYINTPMTQKGEQDPNYGPAIKAFKESIPIGRAGQPEDIAAAASFLLSDAASFICGSMLFVDGGHDAANRPDQI